MNKAILVIDIPDEFAKQLNNLTVKFGFNSYGDRILQVADYSSNEMIFFEYKSEKRLKPLPQEKNVYWKDYMQPIDKSEEQTNIFNKGYNYCLKEILGDEYWEKFDDSNYKNPIRY